MTRPEHPDGPASWTAGKRRRYAWLVTFSLLLLMMLNWADKAVLGIAAVPIMRELHLSPAGFGLLGSAMFGTFVFAQVLGAPIANRVSTTWVLLVLCLLWSVAQLPVLLFATAPALWAGRLLLGLGEGPLAPVMLHGIYKWFPEKKRATPGAVASAGVTLGIVLFSPVLAWLTAAHGWRTAFAILAAVGVVWAVYWLFVGKEGPYQAPTRASEAATIPYRRTILNPTWLLALGSSFFGYWTFTLAMSWGPAYFETVLGFSGTEAGLLIALPSIWGTIAMVGLNALSQRLHSRDVPTRRSRAWLLGGGAIVSGSTVLAAVWVPSPTAAVVLLVIGFGTAPALFPLSLLIVTELTTGTRRGSHLSLANATQTSAGLFAPAVSGYLIGRAATPAHGYTTAFALAGGLSLVLGALCVLFANQQRERRRLGLEPERVPATPTPAAAPFPR